MEIKFKTKEHPEVRTVNYDLPETLQGLVDKFGEENVLDNAIGAYVISLQALARRHIEKTDEEIQKIVNDFDPTTRAAAVRKSPEERVKSAVSKLSAEERAKLLAELQASLAE